MTSLSVLILSPNPRVHGGVSTFIELMKRHLKQSSASALWVGSVPGEKEGVISQLRRMVTVPFVAAWRVRIEKPDAVHINPSLDWKSVVRDCLILLALRVAGYRNILVYFHGWEPGVEHKIENNYFLKKLFVWLLNCTAKVVVLSPEFKDALLRMGVVKQKVATSRTMFDGAAVKKASGQEMPLRRTVLFMSRFVRAKGIFELLEGFASVAAEFPDVDLILAGDGPDAAPLKQRASDLHLNTRVQFPGYVVGDAKFAMLAQCTIYALPTYYPEGMPVALLEAMGAGKPLLTAKTGVIPYIISQPENGIVLDQVTTQHVAEALRQLLSNPKNCLEVGERNRAYAWKEFEAEQVTAHIEKIYAGIKEAA
ncbi:MAG: glycosyltransferase family 4 protein [Rickettsiales bacterium]